MQCKYCFYADESGNRSVKSYGIMSIETLRTTVRKALAFPDAECVFAFQGGEPMLAGINFFKSLVEFVGMYNEKNKRVRYAIQTNGILADDQWASFFSENMFLVGLSLDGPKALNDLCRLRDAEDDNSGSYTAIMKTAQLFAKHKTDFNILTVVSAHVAQNIGKIYGFFKRNKFLWQQYIPCLDPFNEERGRYDYSLTPALYERFLLNLFDLWHKDISDGIFVSVRLFDNLYGMLHGYPPESCGMMGYCTDQFVLEADGGVYPCDFYVLDGYKIGDITIDSFDEIQTKRKAIGFVEVSRQVDEKCAACKHANICRGGCRRDREPMACGKLSLNYYCDSLYAFYDYAMPKLAKLPPPNKLKLR